MEQDDDRLDAAVAQGIITEAQAGAIRALAPDGDVPRTRAHRRPHLPRVLDAATVGYALGAITVIAAMVWFLADRWEWLGAGGALATALLYAVILVVTALVLRREGYPIPSGLAVLLAVATVPPAMLALNGLTGWFVHLEPTACFAGDFDFFACRGEELVIELVTIGAALVAFRLSRFSLLVLPIAGLVVRLIFHAADALGLHAIGYLTQGWIWMIAASACAAAAYTAERRQPDDLDIARWLHVAAVACAVPGTFQLVGSESWYRHLMPAGAFVAFAMALTLRRIPWLLLGMGWFAGYVVWLAASVFRDSPAFPIVLAGLGVVMIILTVWAQRNAERLAARFGVVRQAGRPRFPGGVALLLAPAVLAMVMLPMALREDAVRREEDAWRMQRWQRKSRAEAAAAAASRARARAEGRPVEPPAPRARETVLPPRS